MLFQFFGSDQAQHQYLDVEAIKQHPYDPHAYLNTSAKGWERRLGTGRKV